MLKPRPYYSERGLSAAYYDLVTERDRSLEGDVDFYAGLTPAGGEILELGAGTGRVTLGLAELGFSVTGVDLAPAMLTQAQAKRAAARLDVAARITLRQGDMTSLNLGRTFDSVICAFFGMAHLPAGTAWNNAFQVIARHLAQDGRAAVHLPLPEKLRTLPPPEPARPVLQIRMESGDGLQLFVKERAFRNDIGRFDQILEYVVTNPAGRVIDRSLDRQTFYTGDPVASAQRAGLVVAGAPVRFGDVGEIFVFAKA